MSNQGKIYCAHCIHTGKKYIGQTITLLEYRATQHFGLSKSNRHKFAYALKKYGRSGFIWGIIEESDISLLNDREVYWIEKYDTFKKGYNSTTGGNQGREYCTKEYLIEKPDGNFELIENLTKYCRENNLSKSTMRATFIGTSLSHKGYKVIPRTPKEIGRYEETRKTIAINIAIVNEKKSKYIKENYSKTYLVQKPNGDREEIKNLSQYCRDNELLVPNMLKTLSGKVLIHKGYKLIPRTDEEIERHKNERIIREDSSRKVLPGERNGMFGKKHKNKTKEKMLERKRELFAKTYHLISPEKEEIIVTTTLREFCRKYGLERKSLTNVLKGKAKQHKGWTVPQLA